MHHSPIRTALRQSTAPAHTALEATLGNLGDLGGYARYLSGLYAFRAPFERRVTTDMPLRFAGWQPSRIAMELGQDLDDLNAPSITPAPSLSVLSPARLMGVLYVLEGSMLGARVLCGRAAVLGLSATHGARHLWKQAAALENWRAFLALLESANDLDLNATISGANDAFAAARNAMERA